MAVITEERLSTEERVSRIEGGQAHLATKADVAQSEARTATRIAESATSTSAQIAESEARNSAQIAESEARSSARIDMVLAELAELRKEFAEFRAEIRVEMAKSESRTTRWMLTIGGFGIAAITILYRLLG